MIKKQALRKYIPNRTGCMSRQSKGSGGSGYTSYKGESFMGPMKPKGGERGETRVAKQDEKQKLGTSIKDMDEQTKYIIDFD